MVTDQLSARDRLVAAAFELFEEQGFESTTVDEIAQRAGVGRSTFFRNFASKEDAIFPEHENLLARIAERLSNASEDGRELAVVEAARLVLVHYLDEGEIARARYGLISRVSALRAREVASRRQYQQAFSRFLAGWWEAEADGLLRAELLASAVVTAHNHVLRRWLRNETEQPLEDFDTAMALVLEQATRGADGETVVVVMRSSDDVEAVARRLRRGLAQGT
ncbi:TetR/AcrR family transcriptional regulator [Nocardioides sp. NPDC051685]|uniref:TetR/AcrR family transcriptional regulator n=1 Tax=Nocardioides sp. NPDC051685 TaxID=3364334 RepID=UPI0037A4FCB4